MKKMLALLLAAVLTVQLAVPVWAEGTASASAEETQTETTEVSEPAGEIPEETDPQIPETTAPEETVPETAAPEPTGETEPQEDPIPEEEVSDGEEDEDEIALYATSGTCGTDVTFEVDSGGWLIISGTGAMADYSDSNTAPWYSERERITGVVVNENVTGIGAYAFYGCVNLVNVTLPEGLTRIGEYAFKGCSSLGRVEILQGMTTLGYRAFAESGITEVVLPEGLQTVGSNAFYNCTNLRSVSLPNTLQNLRSSAFYKCSALTAITLPESLTTMDIECFEYCTSLTEIEIPSQLTNIGMQAFRGCTALKSVTLHEGLKVIGTSAFALCESLTEIHLPESATEVRGGAFSGCKNLTSVNLPQGMTVIPGSLFDDCSSLTAITIPDSVLTIESHAFYNCRDLQAVEIPTGVSSIGSSAFGGCASLTEMVIPEGVTGLPYGTFLNCKALKKITLPAGLTEIGEHAFWNCSALESIQLPDKLTTIADGTFFECTALRQVTFPGGLTEIGKQAFNGCTALESIQLPDKLATVGFSAFSGCTALKQVDLPASVATLGEYAFSGCVKLRTIIFGHRQENPLTIGEHAFFTDNYQKDVKTRVGVYSTRAIHQAIRDYAWGERTVTYYSTETIPLQAIVLHAQDDAAEIETGLPLTFTAELTPADATDGLVWSINESSSTGTAEITAEGVLTGLTPGLVTVRATAESDETVYGEVQITLLPPTGEPDSIQVRTAVGAADEAQLGVPVQMQAVFQPGNVADKHVTWSVSNEKIATIDENGLLTPLALGSVTVYAVSETYGDLEGSCVVKVLRYADSVTVLRNGGTERTTLGVGEKLSITALLSPADTTSKDVTWTVEELTGQAELVNMGTYGRPLEIKGVAPGTVRLTATVKDYAAVSATVELTVTDTVVPYALADGSGNIYFDTATGTIVRSDSTVQNVSIPASINGVAVTSIAPYVFHDGGYGTITAVTIPKSMREIGSHAFWSCSKMTSLRFAGGSELETIGEYAFHTCNVLTSVSIPASVQTIENFAFYGCSKMESLRFASGSNLKSIGEGAFYTCDGLTTVSLPEGLQSVGKNAFYYCKNVETIYVPDTVTSFGENAFSYCNSLKNVTITGEENLQKLFCSGVMDNLTLSGTFVQKAYPAKNVTLLDSVTEIRDSAFEGQSVEQLTLSRNLKTIGAEAFENTKISSVTLPEGIVTLGERAFARCSNLTTINLPDSLQSVGKNCFMQCGNLNILDLSSVPDTFVEPETKLDDRGVVPPVLVRATGGKVSGSWWAESVDENSSSDDVAFIYQSKGEYYLVPEASGSFMLCYRDQYTGAQGKKLARASSGLVIRPTDTGYLTAGQSLQLSAWMMPYNTKATVTWLLGSGDEAYATLSSGGLLKAGNVTSSVQITVRAVPRSGEEAVMKLWLVPKASTLELLRGGEAVSGELDVDMAATPAMTFTVRAQPEDASKDVQWSSSDTKIATVSDGVVTFLKPGNVTVKATAKDGSKVTAQVKLHVIYMDAAARFTLTADSTALQPGQTANLTLKGANELPQDRVVYTLQNDLGTVENGIFTAGDRQGTVTVTAALRDDPLRRTANVKLTVLPLLVSTMKLSAEGFDLEEQDGEPLLILDKEAAMGCTFPVSVAAWDYRGTAMESFNVTYTSTDGSLASVTAKGVVTLKSGATGQCAIVATSRDSGKATARLWISVRDYSPRLESSRLTLNSALEQSAVSTGFVESFGNAIEELTVSDGRFRVSWGENRLRLETAEPVPNGNYNLTVQARCADGKTYPYSLSVRVQNVLPKVTVKQAQRLNLFYDDTESILTVTAQGAKVRSAELTDNDDFELTWEDGTGYLRLAPNAAWKPKTTRATLLAYLEGYSQPVSQTISVSTGTVLPKLRLSAASSSLNSALNPDDLSAQVQIYEDKTLLSDVQVWTDSDQVLVDMDGTDVTLTLQEPKSCSAVLYVQGSNWRQAVKLTHKLNVENRKPTLKAAGAITLNAYFTRMTGSTEMVLSQKNLTLSDVTFVPTAKAGTPARAESDKLEVSFDPETDQVCARIADSENAPKPGTYTFALTGTLPEGTELSGGTLRVTVGKTVPKLKLSATSVRLNSFLAGQEQATVTASLTGMEGCTLVGFRELDEGQYDGLTFDDGVLTVTLTDEADKGGTYRLTPVVLQESTLQQVDLPAVSTLRVNPYRSEKLGISLSAKGKLDTLDPDSAIVYAVTRLTNCQGDITGLSLEGPDAELFHAELETENGKPQIRLTMQQGQTYATNVTYKVQFNLTVCGRDVYSPVMSFKVSQSALKFAAVQQLPLYQAQTAPLQTQLKLTAPAGAAIEDISLNEKTSPAFLEALSDLDGFRADPEDLTLTFRVAAPGKLRAGSTYTVLLDVTPAGNAANLKPTQVKLTVKVMK